MKGDLLDDLMAEIPGADGYGNKLFDEGIDGQLAMVCLLKLVNAFYNIRCTFLTSL